MAEIKSGASVRLKSDPTKTGNYRGRFPDEEAYQWGKPVTVWNHVVVWDGEHNGEHVELSDVEVFEREMTFTLEPSYSPWGIGEDDPDPTPGITVRVFADGVQITEVVSEADECGTLIEMARGDYGAKFVLVDA